MSFILQKWNTTTEIWDDLSQQAQKFDLDVHLDIFKVREIEYNGQTLILDDENAIENGDYLRYGTDGPVSNYQNILKGIDSDMSWHTNHHWVAGAGSPTFDINTTVIGKMYYDAAVESANSIKLDLPNTLTIGRIYRVKVKLRLNASGGTNAIRFGSYVGVGSDHYVEFIPTETELDYEDTFTPIYYRDFVIYTLADSSGAFEIDDLQIYLECDPVLFSGYVSNLIHKLKIGKYEFDLISEIADLKTMDIPRVLSGDNLRQRLNSAMPDDYSLVEMDSLAEQLLNIYPTGYDGITFPGDEVTGTDSKVYTCKVTHSSSAINKPITGGSWETYWVETGNTGGEWESGKTYNQAKFNDLLHDILLIANGDTFGNNILYCVVLNKELRMYGVNINSTPSLISNQYIKECEETETQDSVIVYYNDKINDDLRGSGSMNWGYYAIEEWLVKRHKLLAAYEKELMDFTGCARPGGGDSITGFVTGIEKESAIFTYELTNLERVI